MDVNLLMLGFVVLSLERFFQHGGYIMLRGHPNQKLAVTLSREFKFGNFSVMGQMLHCLKLHRVFSSYSFIPASSRGD